MPLAWPTFEPGQSPSDRKNLQRRVCVRHVVVAWVLAGGLMCVCAQRNQSCSGASWGLAPDTTLLPHGRWGGRPQADPPTATNHELIVSVLNRERIAAMARCCWMVLTGLLLVFPGVTLAADDGV